ncbi:MAG: lysophospholipid acyltransferase family protein [Candidatus Melainabacteria bacterium]|nr:lysophospholipid acyltransferase family protein [Candidatus Melainabacteria bacterium]
MKRLAWPALGGPFNKLTAGYSKLVAQCSTPGVMPPQMPFLRGFLRLIAHIWVYIQVGHIEVVGKERLLVPGKVVLCANHSSYFDALILIDIVPYPARYMASHDQFSGLGGIRALVMAAGGAFAVDRSKGRDVMPAAIAALVQERALAIFPEGRINSDGILGTLKSGAPRIALGASKQLDGKEPVYLLTAQIHYNKRHVPSAQGGYGKMAFHWRGGAVVTIGTAKEVSEFETENPAVIIEWLRESFASARQN